MSRRRSLHPAFVVTVSTLAFSSACSTKSGGFEGTGGHPQPTTPPPVPTAPTGTEPISANPPGYPPVQQSDDPAAFHVVTPRGRVNWDSYPTEVNARTAARKQIFRGKDRCYVHGELKEPPRSWVPLPREEVACPVVMTAPHWSHCQGGTLRANVAGDTCLCAMDGNPPPPVHLQDCPTG